MRFVEDLIGKKIRILAMPGDPAESRYIGKKGIVKEVKRDPWGDVCLWGTWGGVAIYPHNDSFEVIE